MDEIIDIRKKMRKDGDENNRYGKNTAIYTFHDDLAEAAKVFDALGNEVRLQILKMLFSNNTRLSEIGKTLGLSNSTVLFHIETLKKAGLVNVDYEPSKKGFAQTVSVAHSLAGVTLAFSDGEASDNTESYTVEMPIGLYVDARIDDYLSFADAKNMFHPDKNMIFAPERVNAGIVWLSKSGFLTYAFPFVADFEIENIEFSLEVCSEAPLSRMDWKSTLMFSLNDRELCEYVCQSDYGDRRGTLTPDWWQEGATQYGKLVRVTITRDGVYLCGEKTTSAVTLADIIANHPDRLSFRIECKPDAEFVGGFNLFGSSFGDYPQDVRMTITGNKTAR